MPAESLVPEVGSGELDASTLDAVPLAVVVDLVRRGRATTRSQLVELSGLTRRVVAGRVDRACELGLLRYGGLAPSDGGRQARTLGFAADAGHVFGVLVEASEITVGVADLEGRILATEREDWSVDNGPEPTMQRVAALIDTLLSRTPSARPWGIGVGVPGPVDHPSGQLVSPPIMPRWHGFSPRESLRQRFGVPVWIDNDVNLMAIGEWAYGPGPKSDDMLFVKVGTGIGSAVISRGRLLRGQRGAAGDIGHVHVSDLPTAVCRCGRVGCLEAVAGGWSLVIDATKRASESARLTKAMVEHGRITLGDIGAAASERDPVALELLMARATTLGEVVASLVNFANPGQLVIGGGVLRTGSDFLSQLSDVVLRRSTPLATDELTIRAASLEQMEGVRGAVLLAIENLLAPAAMARWAEEGTPLRHAAALQQKPAAFA